MHITTNFDQLNVLLSKTGCRFIAALDVEWTKNYRIKNGLRPFCYSITILQVPSHGDRPDKYPANFWFRSVYTSSKDEEPELIAELDSDLSQCLRDNVTLTGHQLSSDLSVVRNVPVSTPYIDRAYIDWKSRKSDKKLMIFDTRYDIDHIVRGKSRRLVDVCEELLLDVTQPELTNSSMTRLHNIYLTNLDDQIREKLAVLNIRHSLSTAVVASLGLGMVDKVPRNINHLLQIELEEKLQYVNSPTFRKLAAKLA